MARARLSDIQILEAHSPPPEELAKRAREQARRELLTLGEQGFQICLPDEFDATTYPPWRVKIDDQTIWKLELGEPRDGYRPLTHCVIVQPDASWYYLTIASATGENAPRSVHELQAAKERAERAAAERAAEQEKALAAKRKTARPVTLADLERNVPATLRAAIEELDRAGGRVRIARGRAIVEAPPCELGVGLDGERTGARIARLCYLAEAALLEAVGGKDGVIAAAKVPDKPVLPSGTLLS